MYENDDECIIRCSCRDVSHLVHLFFDLDEWELKCPEGGSVNDISVKKKSKYKFCSLDITLQVEHVGFFERIKNSFLYIFKQRKFWHYGDIVLDLLSPEGDGELRRMIAFLSKTLSKAEECKKHNESIKEK